MSDPVALAVALAVPLVADLEGFRSKPYRDAVGLPTVGFGRRIPTMNHPPVTEAEELQHLRDDVTARCHALLALCPALATEPAHRLAAVVSFAYNVGTSAFAGSTLRRKIAAHDVAGATAEFGKWVYGHTPDGRTVKLNGLVNRRAREAALFRGMSGGAA